MKKKIFIILGCIVIVVLIIIACYIIGLSFNDEKEENIVEQEISDESKKVVSATILVLNKDDSQDETAVTSSDIKMSKQQFNTYQALINSKRVQDKVKEDYPDAENIEMESIQDTDLIKITYTCDNYSEDECKDIANKYISIFSEIISEVYDDAEVIMVDEPEAIDQASQERK